MRKKQTPTISDRDRSSGKIGTSRSRHICIVAPSKDEWIILCEEGNMWLEKVILFRYCERQDEKSDVCVISQNDSTMQLYERDIKDSNVYGFVEDDKITPAQQDVIMSRCVSGGKG